jgi:hypothetical protein
MNSIARIFLLLLFLMLLLSGCKKTEVIEIRENLIVSGNTPPDYSGVTTLQVQSFVNRLYVDVKGEQPTFDELTQKVQFLKDNDLSMQAREALINELFDTDEYFINLYNYTSIQLLNGISKVDLEEQVMFYTFLVEQALISGETLLAQYFEYEALKMQNVVDASTALQNGEITINEFYKRFCFNLVYDEINMGSENLVISCFENLFNRYPTIEELASGVTMVDSGPAILLLQSGDSKEDFLNIVVNDPEFYVGRVIEQFQSLVLRNPTQIEQQSAAEIMINSNSLQALQLSILKTDEYAGF